MTWRELRSYINKQDKQFLDAQIKVYDYNTGDEFDVGVDELLYAQVDQRISSTWFPYLTINNEVENGKIKETGVY
jgi:hypothetical protein